MTLVWDALLRSLHWLLAAAVITAWTSGHFPALTGPWFDEVHHIAGYVAGTVVLVRVLWGFVGAGHARFAQFVRSPRAVLAYARQLRSAREPRYLGHNPLGAWMVLALLAAVFAASLTGLLYISDWLWGYEWLFDLHLALAWLLMVLVLGHWIGVVFTSWRHRENLVAAMFSGRKRAAGRGDIA